MTKPAPAARQTAYISLGSNLGDRAVNIERGIEGLRRTPGVSVVRVSGVVETPAVKVGEADPGGAFLNAAAELSVTLGPRELLAAMHRVETHAGRDRRSMPHGAPRVLDLDLLMYAQEQIRTADLTVPHPGLAQRLFVLEPLAEIAPRVRVPGIGLTVEELMARTRGAQKMEAAR